MAYEKFIKSVESAKLLKEIERNLIFGKYCNRNYSGEVAQLGDQIRVDGLGDVTVYQLNDDGTYTASGTTTTGSLTKAKKEVIHKNLPGAEEPEGYTATFKINQIYTWNLFMGDIDKELAKDGEGKYGAYKAKYAKKVAQLQDLFIAKTICGFNDAKIGTSVTIDGLRSNALYVTTGTSVLSGGSEVLNILDFIDEIVEEFNNRDYGDNEVIVAHCSPKFWRLLKQCLRATATDNMEIIEGREITTYNNIKFIKSNNCKWDVNGTMTDHVVFRLESAVGFWQPMTETEAYRPDNGFGDAWKGFTYFDCGILEPKALIHAVVNYA